MKKKGKVFSHERDFLEGVKPHQTEEFGFDEQFNDHYDDSVDAPSNLDRDSEGVVSRHAHVH